MRRESRHIPVTPQRPKLAFSRRDRTVGFNSPVRPKREFSSSDREPLPEVKRALDATVLAQSPG